MTINQAAGQADPTNGSPINFTVVFSEPVTGFATGDVTLSGPAGVTTGTVTGSRAPTTWRFSGMTGSGTVIASIAAGVATDPVGNGNTASTSTDNRVTYDVTAPTVTINQAAGQADATGSSPINSTVVFSEPVTGFADGDVTLSGTAGATTGTVTWSGTTYSVAVSGMTGDGTVIATVGADKAEDAAGNGNTASTNTENTVTFENDGPITSNVVANPVPLNAAGTLSANVSDATTGGSNIASAQYQIDGGPWLPMTAQDGAFNSATEYVRAALPGSPTTGVFEVCVRGTDAAGNTGNTECALYAVYDPQGGFVTGGGWFNSPANACKLASCEPDGSTVGKANLIGSGPASPMHLVDLVAASAAVRNTLPGLRRSHSLRSCSADWIPQKYPCHRIPVDRRPDAGDHGPSPVIPLPEVLPSPGRNCGVPATGRR